MSQNTRLENALENERRRAGQAERERDEAEKTVAVLLKVLPAMITEAANDFHDAYMDGREPVLDEAGLMARLQRIVGEKFAPAGDIAEMKADLAAERASVAALVDALRRITELDGANAPAGVPTAEYLRAIARDALAAAGVPERKTEHAGEECPGCEICDLAMELIKERQLVAALTDALRQWVESYPPHRDDCRPFSEHGCSCGVEAARQATAAALAAAEDSTP